MKLKEYADSGPKERFLVNCVHRKKLFSSIFQVAARVK